MKTESESGCYDKAWSQQPMCLRTAGGLRARFTPSSISRRASSGLPQPSTLTHYKDLEAGKWVKVEGWAGRADAEATIMRAIAAAK